jgi:hypothetical protein
VTVNPTANNPDRPVKFRRRRRWTKPEQTLLPAWVHPEVAYWYDEWKLIRDCMEGERAVKDETTRYLPKFDGMEEADYAAYLDGATYYNFTGRTVKAMNGSIFKRRPVISNLPDSLKEPIKHITRAGNSFNIFAKFTTREDLGLGRFGVLVDYPRAAGTNLKPYITGYIAENILDWETTFDESTGKEVLTRLVLREFELVRQSGGASQYLARYRELLLRPDDAGKLVYVQRYYTKEAAHAELKPEFAEPDIIVTRRGETLDFIPFRFFGPLLSESGVEVPPLLDIARLNISHYQSYAHLEHGRFYTGFPVYVTMGDAVDDDIEYEIGPMKVWRLPLNADAKLLEMNGQGLKFLQDACEIKEAQAASLGGRMIGVTTRSVSESDNQAKLKERNEVALLLDISHSLDEGFTFILRVWAWMSGIARADADKIEVEFNKDFILDMAGAREFRAIHAMYKDGVLPIDVVYDYFRKFEVIPDWMDVDEFKKLLDKTDQFPNQPDAEARAEGFPNRQSQIDEERAEEEAKAAEKARQEQRSDARENARLQREATASQVGATQAFGGGRNRPTEG